MAYCPDCKKIYKEPEEEAGSHPCPKCGRYPWDDDDEGEEDEKSS